jgi:hypothetical protein
MKTKKVFILYAAACLCVGSLFTACTDNEPSAVSGTLGEITADRTRFGLGQSITFTCAATWGENLVDNSGIYWTDPSGISTTPVMPDNGKQGDMTYTYVPTQLGTTTITCTSRNLGVNLDNTIVKEFKFNVVACDARTSFWGDSQATVKRDEPRLQSSSGNPNLLVMEIDDEVASVSTSSKRVVNYLFTGGKLSSVGEVVNYTDSQAGLYFLNVRELANLYPTVEFTGYSRAEGYTPSAEVQAVIDKFMNSDATVYIPIREELNLLNPEIQSGNLSLKCMLGSDSSLVTISIGASYHAHAGDLEVIYAPQEEDFI